MGKGNKKNKKNQNKKSGSTTATSMDFNMADDHHHHHEDEGYAASVSAPQAMDISDDVPLKIDLGVSKRNTKKSAPKRRSQNLRKAKAIEKAISNSEKVQERIARNGSKEHRISVLKSLY